MKLGIRHDKILYRNYRQNQEGEDVDPDSLPTSRSDSGLGYFVGELLCLFSMDYKERKLELAIVRRYAVSAGPHVTATWKVSPDWRKWEGTMVIRIAAIARSAHLVPHWGSGRDRDHHGYYIRYFVNPFLDRDMRARIPDCTDTTFTGEGILPDASHAVEAGGGRVKKRKR